MGGMIPRRLLMSSSGRTTSLGEGMSEMPSARQRKYSDAELEAFEREFQSAILKSFLDEPPEPGSLMPWEADEPQEPEQK